MTESPCRFNEDDPVEFAYGEMDPGRSREFEEHLQSCARCREAVGELSNLADLSQWVREQPVPVLQYRDPYSRRFRRYPWQVVAVPAALAASMAILLVALLKDRSRGEPVQPAGVQSPGIPLDSQAVLVGPARIEPARGKDVLIGPGDTILAHRERPALIRLGDGSRVQVAPGSRLRIGRLGGEGDELILHQGELRCEVQPRAGSRPFAIRAGPGLVRVVGTRFLVSLDQGRLRVQVTEGLVEVTPLARPDQPLRLRAGDQVTLGDEELAGPAPGGSDPEPTPPAQAPGLADSRPAAEPAKQALKAPAQAPKPIRRPRVKPIEPRSPSGLVAGPEAWNAAKYFEGIRSEMERGETAHALHLLNVYLSDPGNPARDEATFLRAECLERLGRRSQAIREYQSYLDQWPTGPHAPQAWSALACLSPSDG